MSIPLAGVILAGGASRRFGSDKRRAMLAGRPLLAWAQDCFTDLPYALAGSLPGGIDATVPILPDPDGLPRGPLTGILSGMRWAHSRGARYLATLPCDTPLVSRAIIDHLHRVAVDHTAPIAVAESSSGLQSLCAVWRCELADTLAAELATGHPSVQAVLRRLDARPVRFADETAFLNVNRPEDLSAATSALAARYVES